MNYSQTLTKAQTLLQQKHHAQAVQTAASEPEQIGEAAIRAAREIDTATRILRRTRQVEVSAEREELYEILKRRLFDTEPAQIEVQARAVAQAYWDYYRTHPNDFPQEAQAPEYRELIVRAYPFHPALIETLRDRWGSISGFQRTRGVLRLLALVIGDLYRQGRATPLIQSAHVNLDNDEIRAELLEYVDHRGGYRLYYRSVMAEMELIYPGGPGFPILSICPLNSAKKWRLLLEKPLRILPIYLLTNLVTRSIVFWIEGLCQFAMLC